MIFQKDFWETVRVYRHSQYQNIHLTLQEKIIERVLHEIQIESKFVGGSFMDKKMQPVKDFSYSVPWRRGHSKMPHFCVSAP